MNRNYDYRPRQGGSRDGYGYGNTDLDNDPPMTARDMRILVALVLLSGLVMAVLCYGAWTWLDSL